ncbi:carbohydrate ABC transporter permease [Kitasatospora paranensis]|uniref:Carbohydrate ABC transporter permease n=1 Tax=Kitasatospora paranensis TaxID=258053 RepID=A0ABW2FQR0_9ACTN
MTTPDLAVPAGPRAPRRRRPTFGGTAKYVSLVAASAIVLVPLLVVLLTSLKTEQEAATTGPLTPPGNWFNFANYLTAFQEGQMVQAFVNTTIILGVSTTGTVLIGSMAAYAIDRFEFRLKKLVMSLFLVATLVPGVTTQVATFQIVNDLGAFNTRWAAILLYLGTDIVSIYVFLQFIRSIPISLDEAARLDGANSFTVYWRIILPMLKPAIATVVIIKGITVYNDFYIPFLYMPDSELGTVSTALFRFKGPFGAHWETISAGTVLVILPTLVVFLALQRFIYSGFAAGSTK